MTLGLFKVSGMETREHFSHDMNLSVRMIQNWEKVVSVIGYLVSCANIFFYRFF